MLWNKRFKTNHTNIKFCKHRITQEKAKIKVLDELETPFFNKTLYNKIKECQETIEKYQDSITILKNSIKLMDEERQKVLQRSKKNK